jgi:hypothetical protein
VCLEVIWFPKSKRSVCLCNSGATLWLGVIKSVINLYHLWLGVIKPVINLYHLWLGVIKPVVNLYHLFFWTCDFWIEGIVSVCWMSSCYYIYVRITWLWNTKHIVGWQWHLPYLIPPGFKTVEKNIIFLNYVKYLFIT